MHLSSHATFLHPSTLKKPVPARNPNCPGAWTASFGQNAIHSTVFQGHCHAKICEA